MGINLEIEEGWRELMKIDFNANYFSQLKSYLIQEKEKNQIFPKGKDIFNAFNSTPLKDVKIVIIGQDPYHSFETIDNEIIPHAHGLCFSVPEKAKKIPPSLKNIFKEIMFGNLR